MWPQILLLLARLLVFKLILIGGLCRLAQAAALVISLKDEKSALKILHQVRQLDTTIPVLARTEDETNLRELQEAGATEVALETLEASLMLSSHLLLALKIPATLIASRVRQIRR